MTLKHLMLAMMPVVVMLTACDDPAPEPHKTRIMDVQPPKVEKEPTPVPSAPEPPKVGRAEQTGIGRITDFSMVWGDKSVSSANTDNSGDGYLAFTFLEDNGYQKRFYPVCTSQPLTTGHGSLLYHWHEYENGVHNQIGCYIIDGFQNK